MQRFWEKVDTGGDCWEWIAGKFNTGYGAFWFGDTNVIAHRFAYSLVYGSVPDGLCVCHHCDNKSCVKPSHLFLGTHADNLRDSINKGRFDSRGEKNGNSKLVENDVYEIRRLHSLGVTRSLLTKMWRVSRWTVGEIVRRETWKHI